MTIINPSIFREYDIRGVVDRSLTEVAVEMIGRALGTQVIRAGQTQLALGRDGRLSSPRLSQALIKGLLSTGLDLVDLGQVTTPMVYFAAKTLPNLHSCAVVTGSHNPPEYNGIKMVVADQTLYGDAVQNLRELIERNDFVMGEGRCRSLDIWPSYQQAIIERIKLARPLKVVVDCGNGVAGTFAPPLLRALGCEVVELFCEVDGAFPHHHPDPSKPDNLQTLISTVKREQADIGLAFDGDGDRCGVVDEQGQILYPDRQMMLFARDVLAQQPGAPIVFDIKCSSRLARVISDAGGQPLMWKTGHSLMKAKLRETGAALAGEMSGHIFFAHRWFGFDDGLYSAARLLQILTLQSLSASELFSQLPQGVATSELEWTMDEGEPTRFMQRFINQAQFSDAESCTLDGLRVDYADSWGLVRASNTSPNIVLRFEGDNEDALVRIKTLFRRQILQLEPNARLPF